MTTKSRSTNPLEVKVLYTEGCAATPPTIQLVQAIAIEMDIPISLQQVTVESFTEALTLKFLGSPTVQIDGLDVDPAARANSDYGFM